MFVSKTVVAFVVVLGVCQSVNATMKQPTCRGKEVKMSEDDKNIMVDCMKEVSPNMKPDDVKVTSVPKEKMACFGKCMMTKEGMLDDKGMLSKDTVIAKMNATLPQELVADMDSALEKCVDQHGKNIKPEDKTCLTYLPLTQCITTAFIEVCKEKQ